MIRECPPLAAENVDWPSEKKFREEFWTHDLCQKDAMMRALGAAEDRLGVFVRGF